MLSTIARLAAVIGVCACRLRPIADMLPSHAARAEPEYVA
jgi:hypothetical protein